MSQSFFAEHGGVHFTQQASTEEINRFVRDLPEANRTNLFEVLKQLDQAGLIQLVNDGIFTDGNGTIGGEHTTNNPS